MKRKILALLKRKKVTIKLRRLHPWLWGLCYQRKKLVVINKSIRKKEKVSVLIHEFLHYVRPEWSEKKVRRREDKIFLSLTKREYKRFKKYLPQ